VLDLPYSKSPSQFVELCGLRLGAVAYPSRHMPVEDTLNYNLNSSKYPGIRSSPLTGTDLEKT
jgi:hypothetical protein